MIRLHNSLSREVEDFVPEDPSLVRMYVCGPTVYDTPHVGNCRPAVVFDVLYRLLRLVYPKVVYARNITDIDDKIMQRAQRDGLDIGELTTRTTAEYHRIVDALGCLRPDHEPRATGSIPEIQAMIAALIERGHAYVSQGHVLFEIASFPEHGALSRHETKNLESGASNRVDAADYKRAPEDFILWKPSSAEQPGWDSPWGRGRPGWHIECSAMIDSVFGSGVDIHGGGGDLRFPHHDCEISQTACAHPGTVLARMWLHNGMVLHKGQKIAKSTGNIVDVSQLIDAKGGPAVRATLLASHYRQPLNLDMEANAWANIIDRWHDAAGDDDTDESVDFAFNPVITALSLDLNTPRAFAEMHRLAGIASDDGAESARASAFLRQGLLVLGLQPSGRKRSFAVSDAEAALIHAREEARKNRDYVTSDRLRQELKSCGIEVEDSKERTVYRRSV